MILKLSNKENTYTFTVDDLNNGEKLYYKFQIPASDVVDGKYNMVLMDDDGNIITEEQVCMGYFNAETIQYNRGENVYINSPLNANLEDVRTITIDVPNYTIYPSEGYDAMKEVVVDAQPVYDNGYNEGEIAQKAKLTGITITENGTYSREDGYNEITVDVPDLNGDYNEGYDAGKVDGYDSGYTAGIDYASENAGEIAAANAIDLVATEIGTYYTKYSDNIVYPEVTGVFPNGENFYNYSIINDECYATLNIINDTSKVEIWWNNINSLTNGDKYIFGTEYMTLAFNLNYDLVRQKYVAVLSSSDKLYFSFDYDGWHHIIMSFENGLIVDGKQIGNFNTNISKFSQVQLFLNGLSVSKKSNANGSFGMIKITTNGVETVIIPTDNGFLNTTSNQILDDVDNGGTYEYIDNTPIILDNLIKSVDVQPIINVKEYGIKLGYCTFTEVPDFYDFEGITDMHHMFYNCDNLQTIPLIDTSNVTNMESMLEDCDNLQTIPLIDTSNVTNMKYTFNRCYKIQSVPLMDTRNVTDMYQMFGSCNELQSVPPLRADVLNTNSGLFGFSDLTKLTDFGGLINLKNSITGNYSFQKCPNLTYESCINILNGLWDFRGNGDSTTTRTFKVHQNFLNLVGDEVSIATNKGWVITA